MLFAWLLSAHAAPLDTSWYLAYTGRPEAAAGAAAETLRTDPTSVDAHRLYVWARAFGLREGPLLEDQYRAWVANGGGEAAELTLAWILSWRNPEPGAWCEELHDLTTPLPEGGENRYWAQRVKLESSPVCGGDPQALLKDLLELGDTLDLARPFGLELALSQGLVDSVLQEEIVASLDTNPWSLLNVLGLWSGAQGPRLKETQDAVVSIARTHAEGEDPHLVWASIQVLGSIQDFQGVSQSSRHLALLDPEAQRAPLARSGEVAWVSRPFSAAIAAEIGLVIEAANEEDPALAIKQLKRMKNQLGVDGPGRQAWQLELAAAHARQGKDKKSFRHLREAWAADPTNPEVANQFAYTAALRGESLDAALLAIDNTLAQPVRWDPRGTHLAPDYGHWLRTSSRERGAWLDTRGWVLHAMGRNREAALALEQALLMEAGDRAVQHLHLGLVYADLGKDSLALDHLGRGLAMGQEEEPVLNTRARQKAEGLFNHSHWAAGGLEEWLKTLAPALPGEPKPPSEIQGGPNPGEDFPDLPFFVDGDPTFISRFPGWRVVDIWATWCSPCLESVPHLEDLAKTWALRGVTFLALSVDEEPETLKHWLQQNQPQGLAQGWIGPAGLAELGLDGIPAVFVIDENGVVQASIRGWSGPEDTRLEDALEETMMVHPVESSDTEER